MGSPREKIDAIDIRSRGRTGRGPRRFTGPGIFLLETHATDGFDPVLFIAPQMLPQSGFNIIEAGGPPVGGVSTSVSLASGNLPALDDDPNDLTLDELPALLTGADCPVLGSGSSSVDFEVTDTAARPAPRRRLASDRGSRLPRRA